jgi:FtsZ-binding cell division protein ZapB
MAKTTALLQLEITLATTLQKILAQRELSEWEKGQHSFEAIEACIKKSQEEWQCRLFFDPSGETNWHW